MKKHFYVVKKYLVKLLKQATEENFHLILLKMYSEETFLYKQLNKYLREEDTTNFINLFPFYIFFQMSFEVSFKDTNTEKRLLLQ